MHKVHHSSPSGRFSATLTCCLVAMVAAFVASSVSTQTLIADYPLLTDLQDAAKNYGPVTLSGNPIPPFPPANGVCVNGIYSYSTGGQDVRTPDISSLDSTDFMFEIEFRLTAFPRSTRGAPAIMAGNGWRWIGIYVSPSGTVGLKYNNSNHIWSKTNIKIATWYSAVVMYERGRLLLLLDGVVIHQATLPTLNTGNNKNFTTNDFSNGLAHHGCIRRLRIWNDADLSRGLFTVAGSRCHGLRITGAMPWPGINKPYRVAVSGGNPGSPAVLFFGRRQPTAIDLGAIGAPGCTLFVVPLILITTTVDASGAAFVVLPMPPVVGASARFQWVNFDPKANPLRCRLSDYATLVIGT